MGTPNTEEQENLQENRQVQNPEALLKPKEKRHDIIEGLTFLAVAQKVRPQVLRDESPAAWYSGPGRTENQTRKTTNPKFRTLTKTCKI